MAGELAKKADATALDGKANTSLDNLSDAGKSVIKDTMAGELAKKADATALDGKANTDLSNLTAAGETKIKDTMSADMAKKADKDTVTALDGRVVGVEGKVAALETTVGDASSGLVKDVADLNAKTTKIDYDTATDTTSVNGMKVGQQVDMGGKDIINARALTATGKVTGDGVDAGTGAITGGSLTVTGKVTGNGVDAGTGDITTSGNVKGGTLEATGNATIGGALKATGKVTGDGVDAGTGAITGGSLTVTGKVTGNGVDAGTGDITTSGNVKGGTLETTGDATIGGDLKVAGTITTDKMVFGDKATNNYTEIDHGKVTSKNLEVNGAGETISSSSTFNAKENKVGFANSATGEQSLHKQTSDVITDNVKNNITGDQSFHKQTSDIIMDNVKDLHNSNNRTQTKTETKDIITDENGNSSTTSQTASENKTYLKDKGGKNTNSTIDTAKGYDKTIKGENGETSTKQDELNITNTAKDGTITSDAKDIVNKATGNISNSSATMDTTVTGKATESYGELETEVKGNEKHTVKGDQTNEVDGKQINTIKNGQENIISGGQTNTITGDQTTNVSGTQTTTATDINRNASSSMVDKVDNAYGTNTETKEAGKTTTDVSIKGTGEKGQYIRGANESGDYLIKDTLKNSETKTAEATSTEITDGTNKASTRQDAKNLAGSVTNGTEIGISGIHANDDGSVSIDSAVAGGGMSSVINQKKDSIQSAVGDGTNSTVIHQDKDNVTIASSNGTVGIVGKDIVNNAQNTITNTAGTKITDTAGDSTVTTENGKGTTFTKTGSTAYREGGPTDTNISGNTITTGKVTMDYAKVMRDLGVNGNANIEGKTTTGSLEVKGTSKLTGDVTMENNATVGKNLTVNGITTTKTLKVTENAEVDGTLDVTQKATFHDDVDIKKNLSVDGNATITGDVTANSYKVGDKTYISADGINANNQKITNVADGSISEGSKDAVNGGQLYGVKRDLEHQVDKVGANAAAMANLRPMEFDPSSKWNIAAAIGNYGSETAAALGAFYRPNDNVMVNLSTAFGTGENMVGGGVSVRLGKGGNKLSREETNALKAQVADLTARMDALLSVLNPNMSKDFPDVPENHWAYEAVSRLAGNDIVQGYPDGEFHGERTMTRYEMAEIIYNALSRGAEAERELVEEFKPELQAMAASEKATAEKAEG